MKFLSHSHVVPCVAAAVFATAFSSLAFAQTKVVVDPGKKYQVFEGWGTSLCWWAVKAGAWSEANRSKLIGAIADPDTGLGYTIFRYNIGGGDQPGHDHLTKGDGGGKVPGYKPTEKGDYDWTADPYQRAIALELAKRVKDPIFEAFSNSPPWWMTKSGCVSGSNDGSDNLKEDYFDDFADYLSEVALHFKTEWGLTFRTVEPFNEPSAGWWKSNGGQEGCGFKNNQSRMIVELGKALQKKGLFPETSVSAADETSIKQAHDQLGNYTAEALSYLGQVNTHSYSDGSYRKQLFNRAFGLNKRLWQSETGPLSKSGDEHIALWMANVIIQDLRDMHAEAWIDWQIGDPAENWRSLALNHSKQTFTPNARYYMHAAFSRFIRPGSRIIDSDNGNTLAALTPDGALVLIVRNSGSSDVKYNFDLSEFVKIGTSAKVVRFELPGSLTKQSDIAVSGKSLSMTAPAQTITTMVIDGAEGGACKPDSIIPYVKIHNNTGWDETTDVKLNKGDSLVIGPHPWEGGRWVWSGPNGFTSTNREIRFKNMDGTKSGYYKAVHTNASGCEGSVTFKVVVDDPAHPFVEPDTSEQDSTGDSSAVSLPDFGMCPLGAFRTNEPVQVFDVQGHYLGTMREEKVRSLNAGVYLLRAGKSVRKVRVE
ncbi:MAG: glycosyl hydrolase [Fibrobacter sp.]|nr:glycosyl hydrolase [Fibrobacter sp.]